jgi:hypothetical protein
VTAYERITLHLQQERREGRRPKISDSYDRAAALPKSPAKTDDVNSNLPISSFGLRTFAVLLAKQAARICL